jgi:hypothetical protein
MFHLNPQFVYMHIFFEIYIELLGYIERVFVILTQTAKQHRQEEMLHGGLRVSNSLADCCEEMKRW